MMREGVSTVAARWDFENSSKHKVLCITLRPTECAYELMITCSIRARDILEQKGAL